MLLTQEEIVVIRQFIVELLLGKTSFLLNQSIIAANKKNAGNTVGIAIIQYLQDLDITKAIICYCGKQIFAIDKTYGYVQIQKEIERLKCENSTHLILTKIQITKIIQENGKELLAIAIIGGHQQICDILTKPREDETTAAKESMKACVDPNTRIYYNAMGQEDLAGATSLQLAGKVGNLSIQEILKHNGAIYNEQIYGRAHSNIILFNNSKHKNERQSEIVLTNSTQVGRNAQTHIHPLISALLRSDGQEAIALIKQEFYPKKIDIYIPGLKDTSPMHPTIAAIFAVTNFALQNYNQSMEYNPKLRQLREALILLIKQFKLEDCVDTQGGNTLLHILANSHLPSFAFGLLIYILQQGADVNATNQLKQTPLNLACLINAQNDTNNIDAIRFMLLFGVNTVEKMKEIDLNLYQQIELALKTKKTKEANNLSTIQKTFYSHIKFIQTIEELQNNTYLQSIAPSTTYKDCIEAAYTSISSQKTDSYASIRKTYTKHIMILNASVQNLISAYQHDKEMLILNLRNTFLSHNKIINTDTPQPLHIVLLNKFIEKKFPELQFCLDSNTIFDKYMPIISGTVTLASKMQEEAATTPPQIQSDKTERAQLSFTKASKCLQALALNSKINPIINKAYIAKIAANPVRDNAISCFYHGSSGLFNLIRSEKDFGLVENMRESRNADANTFIRLVEEFLNDKIRYDRTESAETFFGFTHNAVENQFEVLWFLQCLFDKHKDIVPYLTCFAKAKDEDLSNSAIQPGIAENQLLSAGKIQIQVSTEIPAPTPYNI